MNEPRQLPDRLTRVTIHELVPALWNAYRAVTGDTPTRRAIELLAAWWGLETGWGKACHCWNLGNAKSRPGDGRSWTFFRCNEIIGGKVVWFEPPNPGCRFRAFDALEEGAVDWVALVHDRFPEAFRALSVGAAEVAHAAKRRRYYTADEAQYTKTLVGCVPVVRRAQIDWDALEHPPAPTPDLSAMLPIERDRPAEISERDSAVKEPQ